MGFCAVFIGNYSHRAYTLCKDSTPFQGLKNDIPYPRLKLGVTKLVIPTGFRKSHPGPSWHPFMGGEFNVDTLSEFHPATSWHPSIGGEWDLDFLRRPYRTSLRVSGKATTQSFESLSDLVTPPLEGNFIWFMLVLEVKNFEKE